MRGVEGFMLMVLGVVLLFFVSLLPGKEDG